MKTKSYTTIDINLIQPDPSQPRMSFDKEDIKHMATSIKNQGIINAIEVDEKYQIVTGEVRWRAAKEAGLKEVPVKVMIDGNPHDRFQRQLEENLNHHAVMSHTDTAIAYAKLLDIIPIDFTVRELSSEEKAKALAPYAKVVAGDQFTGGRGNAGGIRKLANELGVSHQVILEHLTLLSQDPDVLEYLDKENAKYTIIRNVERSTSIPKKTKKKITEKVMKGEIKDRETADEIIRTVAEKPDVADRVLKETYKEKRARTNVKKVQNIASDSKVSEADTGLTLQIRMGNFLRDMKAVKKHRIDKADYSTIAELVDDIVVELNRIKNYVTAEDYEN